MKRFLFASLIALTSGLLSHAAPKAKAATPVWINDNGNLYPVEYPISLEISNNFTTGRSDNWVFKNSFGGATWLTYSNSLGYPTMPNGVDLGGLNGYRSVFFDVAGNVYSFGANDPNPYWWIENGGNAMFRDVTIAGTTNQVIFGSTNTPPADPATPSKWISVQVSGESTVYRLPLYE